MSFRVNVIPEDPTHNGAILKPLVEAMFASLGKANADVNVVTSPRTQGYEHACRELHGILERYGHYPLHRTLEARHGNLICCAAEPEVEIWLMAGYAARFKVPWANLRSAPRLKEDYFEPFLRTKGDNRRPDSGRAELMKRTAANLPALYRRCPELKQLRDKIKARLE